MWLVDPKALEWYSSRPCRAAGVTLLWFWGAAVFGRFSILVPSLVCTKVPMALGPSIFLRRDFSL